MIALSLVQIVLVVYAVLLLVGGYMGFAKAGSRASLIAGVVSAIATLAAVGLTTQYPSVGQLIGALVALALTIFFAMRFQKSRKFMPAGLMAVVSVVALVVSGLGLI